MTEVRFEEVCVDDELFLATDNNKKGEFLKVTDIENWKTKFNQHCYKITLENGDIHYGWHDRILKKK